MDFVARRLSARSRVLRFDRRPYRSVVGETSMESMAGEVADVLAVASAVHERLLLVGHSSGAVCSTWTPSLPGGVRWSRSL